MNVYRTEEKSHLPRYRMKIIEGPPGDLRQHYRGTGFCWHPGGLTAITAPPGHTWGFENGILTSRPGAWATFRRTFLPVRFAA